MNERDNLSQSIFELITPYECALMSFLSYYEKGNFDELTFTKNTDTKIIINDSKINIDKSKNLVFLFFGAGYRDVRTINDNAALYLHTKGWEFYEEPMIPRNGYKGIAFINHRKQKIVIAHRGTIATNRANVLDDIEIFKGENGNIPTILKPALSFVEYIIKMRDIWFSSYEILQTGHSLGGFIAEFCAAYTATPVIFEGNKELKVNYDMNDANAITFDSLGSVTILNRIEVPTNSARIKNYLPFPNMVNTANPHDGERILLSNTVNETERTTIDVQLSFEGIQNFEEVLKTISEHQLTEIIEKFDPETGHPYKQSIAIKWPNAKNTFTTTSQPPIHPTNDFATAVFAFTHAYTGGVTIISHTRTGICILQQNNHISYTGNNSNSMMFFTNKGQSISENSTSLENSPESQNNQYPSSSCNHQ